MSFFVDKFLLKKSSPKELPSGGQEIRIDVQLNENPNLNSGSLTGTVTGPEGETVSGAVVKVLTKQFDPVAHTDTNEEGQYIIRNLEPGSYNVLAVKGIYLRSNVKGVSIPAKKQVTVDLSFDEPPFTPPLAVVWGRVLDSSDTPIEKAVVNAYSLDEEEEEVLFAETITNATGQYFVNGLPDGDYVFRASAQGYKVSPDQLITVENGNNQQDDFVLVVHPGENKGTVNGIITDNEGQPISGLVFVGLYSLDEQDKETLVNVTKTNENGLYLFGNVEPGKYLIKGKAIEQVQENNS